MSSLKTVRRTSVSKSTSVMSTADSFWLRNLIAAVRTSLHVLIHAAAGVEQEAEMQRRRDGDVPCGEELDLLRLATLDDLEVGLRQAGDRGPGRSVTTTPKFTRSTPTRILCSAVTSPVATDANRATLAVMAAYDTGDLPWAGTTNQKILYPVTRRTWVPRRPSLFKP